MKMRKGWSIFLCAALLFASLALAGCQNQAQRPIMPDQQPATDDRNDELSASERRVMASRLSNMAQEVDGVKDATVVVSSIGMTNNLPGGNDLNRMDNNDGTGMRNNQTQTGTNTTPNPAADNNNANTAQNPPMGTNVSGLVVMVGLTLDQNMTGADQANTIKRTVANRLKASDQRISQVLVTTDPGLTQRLNDVAAGIIQGRPIQGYQDDLNDLMRSMRQQQPAF